MKNTTCMLLLSLSLSACCTMFEGTTQDIAINTAPEGAKCTVQRQDETLGAVTTPGKLNVPKARYNILITCTKAGYKTAKRDIYPDVSGMMGLGGIIGWQVDTNSAAAYEYASPVNITMVKE